jgi:hypothetical protein
MENSQADKPAKTGMTRRNFLKVLGAGLGMAALGTSGFRIMEFGLDRLSGVEEMLAEKSLLAEMRAGKFLPEKLGRPESLDALVDKTQKLTEKLSGVSQSAVFFRAGNEQSQMLKQEADAVFYPASTIKVILCNEIYQQGLRDGKEYLTPELAESILGRSEPYTSLIEQLPQTKSNDSGEISRVTREIIEQTGITPLNEPGTNLRIDIQQQFDYLAQAQLPPIMKEAMRQGRDDAGRNYGISAVLLSNSQELLPAYFKIGLLQDTQSNPPKMVNSYYFQFGEEFKCLGYAMGDDPSDVHEHMLAVGGLFAAFCATKVGESAVK